MSHGFARDKDQAALQVDVIRGLAIRSGLLPMLDFGSWSVTEVGQTGASNAASMLGRAIAAAG